MANLEKILAILTKGNPAEIALIDTATVEEAEKGRLLIELKALKTIIDKLLK
ncbi:MAG: hypothetical protein A4E57_04351 [Syntrophorhabdaceae bacterium PtaU1.Bin034]|jgi:hypothetical protein|nr:MAG: hypothetical protein A4E57_04351 [Syntrophorhabdaceae bacterium PtaU1.Bin034]